MIVRSLIFRPHFAHHSTHMCVSKATMVLFLTPSLPHNCQNYLSLGTIHKHLWFPLKICLQSLVNIVWFFADAEHLSKPHHHVSPVTHYRVCCYGDPQSSMSRGNYDERKYIVTEKANCNQPETVLPFLSLKKLFINVENYLCKYFRSKLKPDKHMLMATPGFTSSQNLNNNHVVKKDQNMRIVISLLDNLIMDIISIR